MFKSLFKKKYRIVRDNYLGYEVQFRTWYWPFWVQAHNNTLTTNTWHTVRSAERFIERHKVASIVVKYVE